MRAFSTRAVALATACLVISGSWSFAGSISFDIKTTVGGNANTKIGSISATMAGPTQANPNAPFQQNGVFTFTAPWGQLDNCYDFRWYQIITSAPNAVLTSAQTKFKDKDGNYTVAPTVPFVDPPSGGYKYQEADGGADKDPYYENSGNGNYAFPNHSDMSVANVSSSTEDSPGPEDVFFETYLVVSGGNIPANTFAVLAGYSWNTDLNNGVLANPDPVQIANVNLANLQTALTNSGFKAADYDNAWKVVAVTNLVECPEPASIILGLMAGVFVWGTARRRKAG